MHRLWRTLAFGVTLIVLVGFAQATQSAEKFPSKQINWYVPSGAGGGTDIFTRTAALELRRILKVPIVVVNMSGGAGARALDFVARQPRDGYAISSFFSAMVGSIHRGLTKVKFDDLVPLARGTDDPQVLVVRAESPFKTVEDLVKDAKARPGLQRWGMASAAGIDGVTALAFGKAAGFKVTLVPFKSGGEVTLNALGGHIDVAVGNPSEVGAQVEAKKMRGVLAFSSERVKAEGFGDVPTAKEKGWNLVLSNWRGVVALKGIPPDRAKILEAALLKAMKHKIFQDYLKNNGMPASSVTNAADFGAFIRSEIPVWKESLIEMGIMKK